MRSRPMWALFSLLVVAGCTLPWSVPPSPPPSTPTRATLPPSPTAASPAGQATRNPLEAVSLERLLSTVNDLAAIQPHSGWRNSGTVGEQEALAYLEAHLGGLAFLREAGLRLEWEPFPVYLVTEIWETGLTVTLG
ncbi:MAG: hypothetical protein ACP5SI_13085, partial [Chloroflexia bacterium]